MGKFGALLLGTAVSLGVGAGYYLFYRRSSTLTPQQLLELAKERVRLEHETKNKRTLLLLQCAVGTIGVIYVYGQIRWLFAGKSITAHDGNHHHHHK